MAGITLGPFELDRPLARGGMGVVWGGTHPGQGVPVAVKILPANADIDAFRNEVQAVAALNHPGVVLVFDHGKIPADAAAVSDELEAGAPWLAMEYASRGSLKALRGGMRWTDVHSVLISVLDALAHAHARGVIHRDIKPGNILIGGPDDLRPGVKLADFGLARGVDQMGDDRQVTGTPVYMAPEQFRGAWRSFGPWTDLYALGVVAWELVCGQPPYVDRNVRALGAAHLSGRLPAFNPVLSVPWGFESWLRRLLAVRPSQRFSRAADAAWALTGLPPPEDDLAHHSSGSIASNPTMTLDDTLVMRTGMHETEELEDLNDDLELVSPAPPQEPMAVETPPLPPSWKRASAPAAPMQLLGAGLNLFGLRTVPLVDRSLERDGMWDALLHVAQGRDSRLLLLQGAAGNGKTRLVEWIAQRAHEVGGATVLKTAHGPNGGPMDGLSAMVARHYRCVGLDRSSVDAELALHPDVPHGEEAALAELIIPAPDDARGAVRLANAEERWVVVERVLRQLARERTVVLWLDDLQWGPDTIAFAHWLLNRPAVGPVLVLCTAQEEALGDLPGARAAVDFLVEHPSAERLPLGPLGPGDREELVRALLGLEGPLARQLAERTGGNPLFTVQLVGDWVARGVLVPGRSGFRLKPGERAVLPDDLHQVWGARVGALLAPHGPQERDALEIAAALGQEVDAAEWALACAEAGRSVPEPLVEALVAARLASPTPEGWAFAHGMLRESLQRLSQEAGRWREHNRACAVGLSTLRKRGLEVRLGRHWYAAGEYARAAELLRRGALAQREAGDPRQATPALALAEEALRRASVADRDPRWGELWLERAKAHSALSELDESLRNARRVLTFAKRHRWRGLTGKAHHAMGQVFQTRGDLQASMDSFQSAARELEEQGDRKGWANALVAIAHSHILGGQIAEATVELARVHELLSTFDDAGAMAQVIRFEGDLARLRGDYPDARRLFAEATELARSLGRRRSLASYRHGVAEMDRLMGDLEEAERGYHEVIAVELSIGKDPSVPRLNLGLCLVAREEYEQARKQLENVLATWTRQRRRGYQAVAHVALVPAVAGVGDWRALDHHLDEFQDLAAATGMTDIDSAHCCENAAALCEGEAQFERARRCWEIAADTWDALGRVEARDLALDRAAQASAP